MHTDTTIRLATIRQDELLRTAGHHDVPSARRPRLRFRRTRRARDV